jgi:hypothetical protein
VRSLSHSSPVEELAAFLARRPSARELAEFRLSAAALARIQQLMDKNSDGALTAEEGRELDRLILLDDVIGLIQSQAPLHSASDQEAETPQA